MKDVEHKEIKVQVYRTPEGFATCSTSLRNNCLFLREGKFGLVQICTFQGHGDYLTRYEPLGYLKPCKECLLHVDDASNIESC